MMRAMNSPYLRTGLAAFALCTLIVSPSHSQPPPIERRESPKLKKFLSEHPLAEKTLTNTISKVFSNRTVDLFYFYDDDDNTKPPAYHYYPRGQGDAEVIICVRENQVPLDEYFCLLFETLNSRSEADFKKLTQEAREGKISRDDFAWGILRSEFTAALDTRTALMNLNLDKSDTIGSYHYNRVLNSPTNFNDFLLYIKKDSKRDVFKEYQEKYDAIRKNPAQSNRR
ncbi:MAG TPA: hypothetical protein VGO67_22585 [Verrucomicrobiae bacterium]|jgi:hypothetical protein